MAAEDDHRMGGEPTPRGTEALAARIESRTERGELPEDDAPPYG